MIGMFDVVPKLLQKSSLMKIVHSVITQLDNKHFDLAVKLYYKNWWFGKEQIKTVFRHRTERRGHQANWYCGISLKLLSSKKCTQLDNYLSESSTKSYIEDRKSNLSNMVWSYHTMEPHMFVDQNYQLFVSTTYEDAEKFANKFYFTKGDLSSAMDVKLTKLDHWVIVHEQTYREIRGDKSGSRAENFYKENGIGYWGPMMEIDQKCLKS